MAVERSIVERELGHAIGFYLECVNLRGFRELVETESSAALNDIYELLNDDTLDDPNCLLEIIKRLDALGLHTCRHRPDEGGVCRPYGGGGGRANT